jgi:hypothetical protein
MVYIGAKAKGLSDVERAMLYALGASTIWYNGRNYLATKASRAGGGSYPGEAAP